MQHDRQGSCVLVIKFHWKNYWKKLQGLATVPLQERFMQHGQWWWVMHLLDTGTFSIWRYDTEQMVISIHDETKSEKSLCAAFTRTFAASHVVHCTSMDFKARQWLAWVRFRRFGDSARRQGGVIREMHWGKEAFEIFFSLYFTFIFIILP